jgi:hypothetical protein
LVVFWSRWQSKESADPERTYVEKIHTPRRKGSFGSGSGCEKTEQEWAELKHAHIDAESADPEHTYVEKLHTPRRKAKAELRVDATAEEWDAVRHAHIDEDAASPHGLVERRSTPLLPRTGESSFASQPAKQQQELDDDDDERGAASDPMLPPTSESPAAPSPSKCPFSATVANPSAGAGGGIQRCPFSGKVINKGDGGGGKCPMLYVSMTAGVVAIVAFLLMEKRLFW